MAAVADQGMARAFGLPRDRGNGETSSKQGVRRVYDLEELGWWVVEGGINTWDRSITSITTG